VCTLQPLSEAQGRRPSIVPNDEFKIGSLTAEMCGETGPPPCRRLGSGFRVLKLTFKFNSAYFMFDGGSPCCILTVRPSSLHSFSDDTAMALFGAPVCRS